MYYINIKTLLLTLLLALIGCTSNDELDTIDLNTSQLSVKFITRDSISSNTRSKNTQLDAESLSFFLFHEINPGETSFVFTPESSRVSIEKIPNTSDKYLANFKIPGRNYGDIQLLVLANYEGRNPNLGESIDDFNENNLIITHSGKIGSDNKPMWGVTTFNTGTNAIETEVTLLRSLARVNIAITDAKDDSEFDIQSITSVYVYRTLNKSTFYVDEGNLSIGGEATSPTIPANAEYNLNNGGSTASISEAEQEPLFYDFKNAPITECLNTIYLPENFHESDALRNEVVTLVVGLNIKGKGEESQERFYRMDFAHYDKGDLKPKDYFSILRNHSYLFQLQGVSTEGEPNPEEALKSKSSLWLEVKKWEDNSIESINNGHYFFGIESSTIELSHEKNSEIIIPFKTNIPEADLSEAIIAAWNGVDPTSSAFEMFVDVYNKTITIHTKNANPTAEPIIHDLSLTVLNHVFSFEVMQLHKTADYIISQTFDNEVNGVYVRNQELVSGVHTATVRLYATDKSVDLTNLRYTFKAEPVQGIFAKVVGLFDDVKLENGLQYQDVTFDIQGMSTEPKNKILTLVTDGISATFLNLEIPYAYRTKTILGLFGNSNPNRLSNNTNFKKLINSAPNFGLDQTSVIKSEPIKYVESSSTDILDLIRTHNPDVIIWGAGYSLNATQISHLKNYVNNLNDLNAPGVVLGMNTSSDIISMLSALDATSGQSGMLSLNNDNWGVITPSDDALTHYRYRLPVYDWDRAVNGLFGPVGTKSTQMKSTDKCVTSLRMEKVLKYTGNLPFAQSRNRYDYGFSMFRLAENAFFWVGSDEFLSDNQWTFSGDKLINCDDQVYESTRTEPIYNLRLTDNGFFFANLLDWAFHTSEYGLR